jgi:hypothetical protein
LFCGCISAETTHSAKQVLDQLLTAGTITQQQHAELLKALLSGGASEWWIQFATTIGSAALAYAGIQFRRGPVATAQERADRLAPPTAPPAA